MQLKYVDTKEEIIAVNKKSKHIEPHLHNALEIVCVTNGALELGVGQELYHMEKMRYWICISRYHSSLSGTDTRCKYGHLSDCIAICD